jgi:hypothetical protein
MQLNKILVCVLALFCLLSWTVQAAPKEVTLKGKIVCAKCTLKKASKCTTAIVVEENGKELTYYLKDKGTSESYHEPVCGGGKKDGTVIGVVSEKDGQKWITPTKVEYAEK